MVRTDKILHDTLMMTAVYMEGRSAFGLKFHFQITGQTDVEIFKDLMESAKKGDLHENMALRILMNFDQIIYDIYGKEEGLKLIKKYYAL